MQDVAQRPLTAAQAASIVFGTRLPSVGQVAELARLIRDGHLGAAPCDGDRPAKRTTRALLAEFMATHAYRRLIDGCAVSNAKRDQPRPTRPPIANDEILGTYQQALKDYFLELIFRRRAGRRGRRFRLAVIIAQVLCLLALVCVLFMALKPAFVDRNQTTIISWLQNNVGEHTPLQWHPAERQPDGDRVAIRLRYRYVGPTGRAIVTERRFILEREQVVEVQSDW